MPKKTAPTTYEFASNEATNTPSTRSKRNSKHNPKRGGSSSGGGGGGAGNKTHSHHSNDHDHDSVDPSDGTGSLTYSAASSVQSGGSAAGESTDSSFADIMRVLDMQDSSELAALCKKEGVSSAGELREKHGLRARGSNHHQTNSKSAGVSVASSLAYSEDGESTALDASQLLQTIAGQPSDSYAFDGGSSGYPHQEEPIKGDNDILFAPAAPVDNYKQRKKEKKARREAEKANATPKAKGGGGATSHHDNFFTERSDFSASQSSRGDTTTEGSGGGGGSQSSRSSPSKRIVSPTGVADAHHAYPRSPSGRSTTSSSSHKKSSSSPTPPLPPKGEAVREDDDDVWYGQWWIACFPDSFKNLMPTR